MPQGSSPRPSVEERQHVPDDLLDWALAPLLAFHDLRVAVRDPSRIGLAVGRACGWDGSRSEALDEQQRRGPRQSGADVIARLDRRLPPLGHGS